MVLRMARPIRRKDSVVPHFKQRIPTDLRTKAVGKRVVVKLPPDKAGGKAELELRFGRLVSFVLDREGIVNDAASRLEFLKEAGRTLRLTLEHPRPAGRGGGAGRGGWHLRGRRPWSKPWPQGAPHAQFGWSSTSQPVSRGANPPHGRG